MEINWEQLHSTAKDVMQKAYAPYSNFKVGVAGLVSDGRIVVGCNSENASYGVGLCAECGLISSLTATGGGRLMAVVCVDSKGDYLSPCGRCRQLLFEHGGNEMLFMTHDGPKPLSYLLPWGFGPEDLK
jgi:cytidine deaminase